ncbi:aspartic peptidase domain-containing protein, partial [Chytriomyces sp. MP71]
MKLIPALLFAISAVDATDSGAITVPFWKSPQKKQGVHKSIKNAQSRFQLNILTPSPHARSIGLQDFSDELYTTNVTFGNGQVFSVDLDTGSSDVWIRGPQCTSQDGSCGTGMPAIDLADSSIKRTGQTWQTGYGSGSVAGDIYKGRVALDTVETTLNFGVSTSETGFNSPGAGLWGLAYASINQIGGGNFVESAK